MESVSEDDVRSAIQFRENLISRTRKLVDMTQTRDSVIGIVARELVNLQKDLRACGLRCVEKIVAWTLSQPGEDGGEDEGPAPFLWEGEEYLCKMLNDLNFVARELKDNMRMHHSFELE
jgi:hypothetical protein